MKSGGLKGKQHKGFVDWKMALLFGEDEFDVPTLTKVDPAAPVVGILRAFSTCTSISRTGRRFFHALGMRVVLSPPRSTVPGMLGNDTIPSQTLCFPAKLAHGHLAQPGARRRQGCLVSLRAPERDARQGGRRALCLPGRGRLPRGLEAQHSGGLPRRASSRAVS